MPFVGQLRSYQYKDQIQNLWQFYCLSKINMNQWNKVSRSLTDISIEYYNQLGIFAFDHG